MDVSHITFAQEHATESHQCNMERSHKVNLGLSQAIREINAKDDDHRILGWVHGLKDILYNLDKCRKKKVCLPEKVSLFVITKKLHKKRMIFVYIWPNNSFFLSSSFF